MPSLKSQTAEVATLRAELNKLYDEKSSCCDHQRYVDLTGQPFLGKEKVPKIGLIRQAELKLDAARDKLRKKVTQLSGMDSWKVGDMLVGRV